MKFTSRWFISLAALAVAACHSDAPTANSPLSLEGVAPRRYSADLNDFTLGTIHYQGPGTLDAANANGYVLPTVYGAKWTVKDEWNQSVKNWDQAVVDISGNKVWRLSNAVTGSHSDQPTTPSSAAVAGESADAKLWNDRGPLHTSPTAKQVRATATTPYFHAGFKLKSSTGSAQAGMVLYATPVARQSDRRMSSVSLFADNDGLRIKVNETGVAGSFPAATTVAELLSLADWHQVDIYMEFVPGLKQDGSGNDILKIFVDGTLAFTGTSWETYYRVATTAEPIQAVDALAMRAAGTAVLANLGNGFDFDDFVIDNAQAPVPPPVIGGPPVTVQSGTNVTETFLNETGTPVAAIKFANVATTGAVSVAPITTFGGDNPAPAGFALGDAPVYYDIDFTGTFTGSIEVCLVYAVGAFAGTEPSLFHYEGGAWKNVTTGVNTTTRTVCGNVTSFSPFAIGVDLSAAAFTVNVGNPVQVNTAVAINGTVPSGFSVQYRIGSGTFTPAPIAAFTTTGVYTVCLRLTDGTSNGEETCVEVPVYDPTAGFVTGGGWFTSPAAAYKAGPTLTGKAHFAFVSKYEKGKNIPTGNTSFKFDVAGLSFASTSYEWLIVNQAAKNAQYKGVGTLMIGGVAQTGNYGFMLWAQDDAPDRFRIQITNLDTDAVVYDNKIGSEFGTAIGGGNIMLHIPKK